MLDAIIKVFNWLRTIWSSLSEETKQKIIKDIVDSFDEIFRSFYKSQQEAGEPNVNS